RLGDPQAALDLADAFQESVKLLPVALAETGAEVARLPHHGVEDAAILGLARQALLDASALAEQALEDLAWIDFHRHGLGGRAPAQGVHVDAAVVAVAGA